MLKLMYITNSPEIAKIADNAGVDRIWIDLEKRGKEERQKNLNTVKSNHEISDIGKVKKVLKNAELIVRVNSLYDGSEEEIEQVIEQGADVIMLPYFKTPEEVRKFVAIVNKRTKVNLLCETPESVECMDEILKIAGIDEIHIGLNDLHLGYKKKFMFELLADGTVEKLCNKFKKAGIPYGFGGIARIGEGALPAENIIPEHCRLGSTIVILSRSFCDTTKINNIQEIQSIFKTGVEDIRAFEKKAEQYSEEEYKQNKIEIEQKVRKIIGEEIEK